MDRYLELLRQLSEIVVKVVDEIEIDLNLGDVAAANNDQETSEYYTNIALGKNKVLIKIENLLDAELRRD